jgi:hypothetical protein
MDRRFLALSLAVSLVFVLAVAWSPIAVISPIAAALPVLTGAGPLPLADVAPETTTVGGDQGAAAPLALFALVAALAFVASLAYLARIRRRREG